MNRTSGGNTLAHNISREDPPGPTEINHQVTQVSKPELKISQHMSNKPELGENHKGSVGVFGDD
jgi:hypothetical protein